jgi:3-hydroxyisobutyrate dehydrogenase-like beta-hydroxyacid dehydrogenase
MSHTIAILGLGEAGSLFASDLLQAGFSVRGYDPNPEKQVANLERCSSVAQAVTGASVVLSLNWARVSLEVAESVRDVLNPDCLYADLNTAAPKRKQEIATALTGIAFADVALLNPVPGNGIHTPALVSGSGAEAFAQTFSSFGMPVKAIGTTAGEAAAHKLVRSVFYKGLAACVGEALEAAEQLGCHDWLYNNIGTTL